MSAQHADIWPHILWTSRRKIHGHLARSMPSGAFAANAAWLAIAAMAHNLVRAAGALADLPFAIPGSNLER